MRKTLAAFLAGALLAGGTFVALAQEEPERSGFSGLDFQVFKWKRKQSTTSSKRWIDIPGMHDMHPCLRLGLSATVSLVIRGAPVEVRVRDSFGERGSVLRPGGVTFRGGARGAPGSFTFVRPVLYEGAHTVDVQWRSPTGKPATIRRGDVNLLYQSAPCTEPGDATTPPPEVPPGT